MTIKQMQHLLGYLGYDTGGVDGVLGPKTQRALDQVRARWGEDVEAGLKQAIAEETDFWESIRYFSRREMACPCGRCGGFPAEPSRALMETADAIRGHFDRPMRVSSGVRCRQHNDALSGSVPNSRHLRGLAMDFMMAGVSPQALKDYIEGLSGVRYCYIIPGGAIHFDMEG